MISKRTLLLHLPLALFLAGALLGAALPEPITPQSPQQPTEGGLLYLPIVLRAGGSSSGDEWTQFAHDAQRTAFSPVLPATPWRWKWAWNGPNASGGVSAGKFGLPRNSQPVTGGGRVNIAAGGRGIYALNQATGTQLWNANPGGAQINSTPAYDPADDSLFVVSSNGTLYKLNAASGAVRQQFASGASSTLPLPPALQSGQVWFSMGDMVYALRSDTLAKIWEYDAGSPVHTPPAYSPATGRVIVVSQDLYVHAIRDSDGTRLWRVKPTPLNPGDPGNNTDNAEALNGWPVIAEEHGLVLIKLRLDWDTLWNPWSPWPSTNAAMRAGLTTQPQHQALFALRLSDGSAPFVVNVGHGGFGDGGYMPMGPMPVVKRFSDGTEAAYVVMRGDPCLVGGSACDGRGDSRFGELLLDNTLVPGYQAGDVRFMQNTFFPTDEQAYLSMAGDALFGGHWMFGIAHRILDRSSARGSGASPITVSDLPHIAASADNCPFSASHYCADGLVQSGDARPIPGGFYIYYNQPKLYDQYWSGYAAWVISGNTILYVSTDGAVAALEPGQPAEASAAAPAPLEAPDPAARAPEAVLRIPYTAAAHHAGQYAAVEGTLRWVFNNRKAVYLAFKDPHQGAFLARILKEDWAAFPQPPEMLYPVGTSVRITGWIGWYQGDPYIQVISPAQIEILP